MNVFVPKYTILMGLSWASEMHSFFRFSVSVDGKDNDDNFLVLYYKICFRGSIDSRCVFVVTNTTTNSSVLSKRRKRKLYTTINYY